MDLHEHIKPAQPTPVDPNQFLASLGGTVYQDRYPYNTPDSNAWLELFIVADQTDRRLYEILDWFRAVGTALLPDNEFGYRLQPIIGPCGWQSMDAYARERDAYLVPYGQTLVELLRSITNRLAKVG